MKTLQIIMAMVFAAAVAAAEIKIDVIQYNPETQKARIIVANTGPQDYHDISFALGSGNPTEYKGSTLKAGTAITIPKIVPQGMYTATIITREGETFTQELLFAPSGKQILPDSIRIKNQTATITPPVVDTAAEEKTSSMLWLLILLAIAGCAGAAYWYFRKNPAKYAMIKHKIAEMKNGVVLYAQTVAQKITGKKPRQPVPQAYQPRPYQRPGQYQQAFRRPGQPGIPGLAQRRPVYTRQPQRQPRMQRPIQQGVQRPRR